MNELPLFPGKQSEERFAPSFTSTLMLTQRGVHAGAGSPAGLIMGRVTRTIANNLLGWNLQNYQNTTSWGRLTWQLGER
jgi:hypothetical protein